MKASPSIRHGAPSGRMTLDHRPVVPNRTPVSDLMYSLNLALDQAVPQGPFAPWKKDDFLEGFTDTPKGELVAWVNGPQGERSAALQSTLKTEFPQLATRVERSPDYLERCAERGFATVSSMVPGILTVDVVDDAATGESPLRVVSAAELSSSLKARVNEALQDGGTPRIAVSFAVQPR